MSDPSKIFPKELWYEISWNLSSRDWLSLTQVNRELRSTFKSQEFLIRYSRERWFTIDDQSIQNAHKEEDWFEYCLQRMKMDEAVHSELQSITKQDKDETIYEKMTAIIKASGPSFVPVLLRLVKQVDDLPLRYFSSQLLMACRHSLAFKMIKEYSERIANHDTALRELPEEILFKLSYMDPAFDKLLPHRKRVLNEIVGKVKRHALLKLHPGNPILIVLLARDLFFEVIKFTKYSDNTWQEDQSILRVYAGESKGTHMINLAILHKIVIMLGVKAELSRGLLIIKKSDGEKYYVHLSRKRIEVRTEDEVMEHLNQYESGSVERDIFLSPIQADRLLDTMLEPGGYDSLRCVEGNENDQLFYEIFPVSESELSSSYMLVAFYYWRYGLETSPELTNDDVAMSFYEETKSLMQYDFALTMDSNLCTCLGRDRVLSYMKSDVLRIELFGYHSRYTGSEHDFHWGRNFTDFRLGDIISDGVEYGVLYHATIDPDLETIYCKVYCGNGQSVSLKHNESKIVRNPTAKQLKLLLTDTYIGLLFHHYDRDSKKFIPTDHLLKFSPLRSF